MEPFLEALGWNSSRFEARLKLLLATFHQSSASFQSCNSCIRVQRKKPNKEALISILCQIVTIRCDSKWTGACCQTWLSINWGPFGNDHRTLLSLMLSCNPGALACGSCSLGKMKWIEMACETMEQGLLQIKNRQLHGPLAHGGRLLSF